MLIKSSGTERIPRIQLGYNTKMYEPVVLEHLMHCRRSTRQEPSGRLPAIFFSSSLLRDGSLSFAAILSSSVGMPAGIHDYCVTRYIHRFQLFRLSKAARSVRKSRSESTSRSLLEIKESGGEHPVSQDCMPRCPLLLKFSEYACIICIEPFGCHKAHYPVAVALARSRKG